MDASAVPAIYAPTQASTRLDWFARSIALALAGATGSVLIIAARLNPDSHGVGTHTALGLARCPWLYATGLPCPSCGMTTSFAFFAHGNPLASFYVQPMGCLLAILAAVVFWIALYSAATGKAVHRLTQDLTTHYLVLFLASFALLAWGWKILIHLNGMDGWQA